MSRGVWLWWSGGKDSAWALHRLLDDSSVHVKALVTTIDAETHSVPLQGIGSDLLELQTAATGLPLHVFSLPSQPTNEQYVEIVQDVCELARASDVSTMAFGDLHLEDLRQWRNSIFDDLGVDTLYPLWGSDTRELALEMIDGGLEAKVTCIDASKLDSSMLGRAFDHSLLAALPAGVDPCGENGEFHTFVGAGPMLHDRLEFEVDTSSVVDDRGFLVAEPVLQMPLDGTLDLHGIAPREIGDLVDDYLSACRAAGVLQVRIVHGKGVGVQRERVHARLRRREDVEEFSLAGEGGGGWGATIVRLRAAEPEKL